MKFLGGQSSGAHEHYRLQRRVDDCTLAPPVTKRHVSLLVLCFFPFLYSVAFSCSVISDSFETPWTIAGKALLSMGFCTEEYRSGLPFLPPEGLPGTRIEPTALACPVLAGRFFAIAPPGKSLSTLNKSL